jgi:hypothetical protein
MLHSVTRGGARPAAFPFADIADHVVLRIEAAAAILATVVMRISFAAAVPALNVIRIAAVIVIWLVRLIDVCIHLTPPRSACKSAFNSSATFFAALPNTCTHSARRSPDKHMHRQGV